MKHSRAKLFAVAASARYEPGRSGASEPTDSQRNLPARYGVFTAALPELMLMKCHEVSAP